MKTNTMTNVYRHMDAQCSETQLVLLLLDGALRFTREAVEHLKSGRWAEKGTAVESALECLVQLRKGLNHESGEDVVVNLDRMYDFLATKLAVGNAARDEAQLEQIIVSLLALRTAWAELFDRLKAQGRLSPAGMDAPAAL